MTASRVVATIILSVGVCFSELEAEAQLAAKLPRVGVLGNSAPSGPSPLAEALRTPGWVDGQNVIIEQRYIEGDVERALKLAGELVRLNVEVIVAAAPPNVRAAQKATSSIPIVMWAVSDPVRMGFVSSLARPGGNITGVTSAIPEGFLGKQLQLIKEAIPAIRRVASRRASLAADRLTRALERSRRHHADRDYRTPKGLRPGTRGADH